MNSEAKAALLARVDAWLAEWPDDEPLPEGLDPDLDPTVEVADLATLSGAVTACAREMQIQSKAIKRLGEASDDPQPNHPGELLAELADVHDRLQRCLSEGERATLGLSRAQRWAGAAAPLHAVCAGFSLVTTRVGDLLAAHDVREIPVRGMPFDPSTMRAVARVAADSQTPANHVAEVERRGYSHGNEVLRLADVHVARPSDS